MAWERGDFDIDDVTELVTVVIDGWQVRFTEVGEGDWEVFDIEPFDPANVSPEELEQEIAEVIEALENPELPPELENPEDEPPSPDLTGESPGSVEGWDELDEAFGAYESALENYDSAGDSYDDMVGLIEGLLGDVESAQSDAESLADDIAEEIAELEDLAEAAEDAAEAAEDALDTLPNLMDPLERLESAFDPGSAPGVGGQVDTPWSQPETAGDPVNLFTGAFHHHQIDVFLPGVGFDLQLDRAYNNQSYGLGIFGQKWTCWLDASVREMSSEAVYVWFGNGQGAFFAEGSWDEAEQYGVRIERDGSGHTLHDLKERVQVFDGNGRIVKLMDRFGNSVAVSRNADGMPTRVSQGSRWFELRYNGSGLVDEVEDHAGRIWSYAYAQKWLVTVTSPPADGYPSGIETHYDYDSGSDPRTGHNLVSVSDHLNRTGLGLEYGQSGRDFNRVTTQTMGGSDSFSFEYEYPSANLKSDLWSRDFVTHQTTVTDPRGVRTAVEFNPYGQPRVKTRYSMGLHPSNPIWWQTRIDYFSNGNIEKVEFPEGETVLFGYDDAHRDALRHGLVTEIRRVARPGSPLPDLVSSASYGAVGVRNWALAESGEEVHFTLDGQGRVTLITYPRVTLADGTTHVASVSMTWRSDGQLELFVDAEGTEHHYQYYTSGTRNGYRKSWSVDGVVQQTYDYDAEGRMTQIDNVDDDSVFLGFDALNRLLSRTWSAAPDREHKFEYDHLGNVVVRKERHILPDGTVGIPEWFTDTFAYDWMSRLIQRTQETSGGTAETIYSWSSDGRLLTLTDPTGLVVENTYDERGLRLTQTVAPGTSLQVQISHTYDDNGEIVFIESAEGEETVTYDGHGRMDSHTYADGRGTRFEFDDGSRLVRIEGTYGATITYVDEFDVDEMSRTHTQRSIVYGPSGPTGEVVEQSTQFDRLGRAVRVTAGAVSLAHTYDVLGRITETIDAAGNKVTLERLANGLVERAVSALVDDAGTVRRAHSQTFGYTAMGELAHIEDPLGNRTVFHRDSAGRLVEFESTDGTVETMNYGEAGHLLQWSREWRSPDGTVLGTITEDYEHDAAGRLTAYLDSDNRRTELHHNARGDLTSIERPGGVVQWTWAYDDMGQMETVADPRGVVQTYGRDPYGRVVSIAVSGLPPSVGGETFRSYALDARGVPECAENDFAVVEIDIDSQGRTTREAIDGWEIQADYGSGNAPDRITYGSGLELGYTWDDALRLRAIAVESEGPDFVGAAGLADLISAEPVGATGQHTLVRGGAQTVSTWVDASMRPLVREIGGSWPVYTVFDAQSMLQLSTIADGDHRVMGNDNIGQLSESRTETAGPLVLDDWLAVEDADSPRPVGTQMSLDAYITGLGVNPAERSWSYDAVGNRTETSDGVGTTTYRSDVRDALTTVGGVSIAHDAAGNLTDDGTRILTYDHRGRLIGIEEGGVQTASLEHGPLGRPVRAVIEGRSFDLRYFGPSVAEVYEGSTLVASAVHGVAIDRPLALLTDGRTMFVDADVVGTPFRLSDETGTEVATWQRSPYGVLEASTGDAAAIEPLFPFMGFQGHLALDRSVVDFRNRAYHSDFGRFLQLDPAAHHGGSNLYAFAGNQPATYTDPYGEFVPLLAVPILGGAAIGGVIGGASTYLSGGSWTDVMVHAGAGAVGGAIMGTGYGAVSLIAGGAIGSAISLGYEGAKTGGASGAAIGVGVGLVTGGVGGGLAGPIANRISTPLAASVTSRVVAWGGRTTTVRTAAGVTSRVAVWKTQPATRWLSARGISHHTAGYIAGSLTGVGVGGGIEGGIEGSLSGGAMGFGMALNQGQGFGNSAWQGLTGSFVGGATGSLGGGMGSVGFRGLSGWGFSHYAVRGGEYPTSSDWKKYFGQEGEFLTSHHLGTPLHGGRMPGSTSIREPDLWNTAGLYGDVKNVQSMNAGMWRSRGQFDEIAREIASFGGRMTIFHRPGVQATQGFRDAAEDILGAGNLDLFPIPQTAFQPPASAPWLCF